jgi:hypothetical protein
MDKDNELASKVDALLSKHAVPPAAIDDRNIPVLNEIVDAPEWTPPSASLSAHATSLPPYQPGDLAAPNVATPIFAAMSESEIDQLSQDIFTRVFDRLDGELGVRLEEQLTDRLASQINAVVTQVYGDLRQEIANEIGDAINAALADRIRRT